MYHFVDLLMVGNWTQVVKKEHISLSHTHILIDKAQVITMLCVPFWESELSHCTCSNTLWTITMYKYTEHESYRSPCRNEHTYKQHTCSILQNLLRKWIFEYLTQWQTLNMSLQCNFNLSNNLKSDVLLCCALYMYS